LDKRDFISIADLSGGEMENLFAEAEKLKREVNSGVYRRTLEGRTLAMIFEKPSTRTRVGFEAGMTQLGGHAMSLFASETQIGRQEPLKDTARVLAGYCDCILIRTFGHAKVVELARWSEVPVINGLSDLLHPCQVLSDLFTIRERFGSLEGVKVAYIGDGNNVANSWIVGASAAGLELALACPEGYDPDPGILARVEEKARGRISVTRDPVAAAKNANVLYTDVWASMGQEEEAEKRKEIFSPYQVSESLVGHAAADVIVMHCLPAHRGEEITDEVLEGPRSVIFRQASNRLHVQKALLEWLIKRE